jgi:hypothetical protein
MATPPQFSAGAILTAAQMNAVGMWRITSCTVTSAGGTAATASNGIITMGSGNTSVTVANAFSSDFDNYRIVISNGVASGALAGILLHLGSTTSGYYYGGYSIQYTVATLSADRGTNLSNWQIGYGTPNALSASVELQSPNLATYTMFQATGTGAAVDSYAMNFGGYLNNTTQYTDFTITPGTGNFSNAKIYVYGYNK